jgi:hypothetical protein
VHGFDDKEEWGATLDSLAAAGVAEDEVVNGVVAVLVAVLNVGNLDFDQVSARRADVRNTSAGGGWCSRDIVGRHTACCATCSLTSSALLPCPLLPSFASFTKASGAVLDKEHGLLRDVCDGLGLGGQEEEVEALLLAGAEGASDGAGDDAQPGLAAAIAKDNADKLCKALFAKLFDTLKDRVNATFAPDFATGGGAVHIGVLDLPGFENLVENGFDQLLVNLAAEQLQEQFHR